MPVIAIPLPKSASIAASRIVCPWGAAEDPGCDFSGDGRVVGAVVADRSAWHCPLFYLALPASALLVGMVVVVRGFNAATGAIGRLLS
ncbi:hypothetical protein HMP09_0829 [Sphingomonas sp. HMP9]|uniref:hypothetical protein n=1 Tax=Sphingomonas sp. HMP9 TaxID=1517554 RepID=UPI0015967B07|nr:hypothetical protein [Sphingomonas sp. HMP9]BCA61595.1 hypothetical protein HMP09_0829 [Sphingomonas sp. HMP9]